VKYLTQRYDYLSNIKLADDRKEAGVMERTPYGLFVPPSIRRNGEARPQRPKWSG